MFKNIKFIAIVFVIISLIFIGSTAVLYIILEGERAEKTALQDELAEIMKERKRLALEMDELKLIKGDLELKLSALEVEAKMLAENYEKEKSQNDVVRLELSEKTERLTEVETKLESIASEKEKFQEMLNAEKARYDELKERVEELVEVKEVLEEKVRDVVNRQGVELERIVVRVEGELEGRVVVVNREYNFIVVDVGIKNDVEMGDFLTIFRSGKYVGEAQVEKIYDTMSAATIIKETKPKAIMVDDNVIIRSN